MKDVDRVMKENYVEHQNIESTPDNGHGEVSQGIANQHLTDDLAFQKERTLLAAWLISLWAPIGSGVAFLMGRTSVQLADLLRRSSELLALFLAWLVHRRVSQNRLHAMYLDGQGGIPEGQRLENLNSLFVGIIMIVSVLIITWSTVTHVTAPVEPGVIWPGLLIASGGAVVNGYFWLKFSRLNSKEPSPIFETQWRLYRAKTIMDLTLIVTLTASRIFAGKAWSVYLDPAGSLVVAVFMLGSAVNIIKNSVSKLRCWYRCNSHF